MRSAGIPTRRPLLSVSHTTGVPSANALSMVPTTSSAVASSSRLSSLGVWTTPMRSSMRPNLVGARVPSALERGLRAGTAARPAVGEAPARLGLAVERGHAGPRLQPRVDQPVLGLVVEGVGERELLGAAEERVVAQPARGAADRVASG